MERERFIKVVSAGLVAVSATVAPATSATAGPRPTVEFTDQAGRVVAIPIPIKTVFCSSPIGWNITPTGVETEFIPEKYRTVTGLGEATVETPMEHGDAVPVSLEQVLAWDPQALLYPDRYPYDTRVGAKKFYRLFYQWDLTDAQYDVLIKNSLRVQ